MPHGAAANVLAIPTYHYDNWRTGWNRYETTLSPANVANLQLQTTVGLDEQVDAQPLFAPNMTIAGVTYNVVYIATENDTIYAIDAATGRILLQQNFGQPVPQSVLPGQCNNNSAVVGINSTPVLDLKSQTLYVMIYTYENGQQIYRLHALDPTTLTDKTAPAIVQATATLSDGENWNFAAAVSRQRAGLLEAKGNIYAGFASFCDFQAGRSRGWLLGWRAGSLNPLPANRLNNKLVPGQSPDDFFLSSIWMSGYGIAADGAGRLFFATGNSDPSGTTYNSAYNLSESIVEISPDLTKVLGYFTPSGPNGVDFLDRRDGDFGSGGVLVMPSQPGNLRLAIAAGKAGTMYLLDRGRLGGYHNPNRVLGAFSIDRCWCGESYFEGWDGAIRIVSSGGSTIGIWKLQTTTPVTLVPDSESQSLQTGQDPGFMTSVSSNGTTNSLVWAVGRPVDRSPAYVTLYAYDPQAAANGQNGLVFSAVAGTWPNLGGNANIVPVVDNGRVYVASYKMLAIFQLGTGPAGRVRSAASPIEVVSHAAAELPLPPGVHEIVGTIEHVSGHNITLATKTGKSVRVDAEPAMRAAQNVILLNGEPVAALGRFDRSEILHATSVLHAKPSTKIWPADR